MNKRNWFFTRIFDFVEIGYSFSGYGTIIIEGDSLLNYIETNFQSQLNQNLKNFFKKLNECNLAEYRVVFFTNKSRCLNYVENFQQLGIEVDEFSDWNNDKWMHFINDSNISLFLVSKMNIFKENEDQYNFIYEICVKHRIQVALIDNIIFHNINVFSSIIFEQNIIRQPVNSLRTITIENPGHVINDTNDNTIYQINNPHINSLVGFFLKDSNNNIPLLPSITFSMLDTNFKWKLEFYYRKQDYNQNSLIKSQKYYRYMEVYASSLEFCKNLHHRIVTQIDDLKESKVDFKTNKKTCNLIEKNIEDKRLRKEKKELEFLKTMTISCYDDIGKNLSMINTDQFLPKPMLQLQKLKIKWLNYEPNTKSKKINTLILMDKLSNNYLSELDQNEIFILLNSLKNQGFDSLCRFYANEILSKNKCEQIKELSEKLKDSFNHDTIFQLKYLGEHLPRTLDSIDDPRVCFKPDYWQKNLLDIVDRNESALICILKKINILNFNNHLD